MLTTIETSNVLSTKPSIHPRIPGQVSVAVLELTGVEGQQAANYVYSMHTSSRGYVVGMRSAGT